MGGLGPIDLQLPYRGRARGEEIPPIFCLPTGLGALSLGHEAALLAEIEVMVSGEGEAGDWLY